MHVEKKKRKGKKKIKWSDKNELTGSLTKADCRSSLWQCVRVSETKEESFIGQEKKGKRWGFRWEEGKKGFRDGFRVSDWNRDCWLERLGSSPHTAMRECLSLKATLRRQHLQERERRREPKPEIGIEAKNKNSQKEK